MEHLKVQILIGILVRVSNAITDASYELSTRMYHKCSNHAIF